MPINSPNGLVARPALIQALSQALKIPAQAIAFSDTVKSLDGIQAIHHVPTAMTWFIPVITGETVASFNPPVLITNKQNMDLTQFNVDRGNFQQRPQYSFTTGFTLRHGLETVVYEGVEYRWTGAFPKTVVAGGLPMERQWEPLRKIIKLSTVLLDDYLPYNFDRTGSVDYASYLKLAINESARDSRELIMPACPILLDITNGSVTVPNNSVLRFRSASSLNIAPNSRTGYSALAIVESSNVTIHDPVIYGDKYAHLGDAGEQGHGISITGAASDIKIIRPRVYDNWGDGIYIGQTSESRASSPRNVFIDNPVCLRNRRQGISVTSADGLTINNPVFRDTKSSDSRFTLVNGPHAGIDIEPNHYESLLRNIRINNVTGSNNDGPLVIISLSNAAKNAPADGVYPLNIKINGVSDTASFHAVQLLGASSAIKYTGGIAINTVNSNEAIANGISVRTWRNKSVPVVIDGVDINDWWSTESDIEYYLKSAICIDRGNGSPELGGIYIKKVKLKNYSQNTIPMLIGAYNTGGQVNDTIIEVDSVDVAINTGIYEVRDGDATVHNTNPLKGAVRLQTANITTSPTAWRDIHINRPESLATIDLADMTSYISKLSNKKFFIKFTPGLATTFRIRSSVTPLVVNGVSGITFTGNQRTGLCTVEFDGYTYFVSTQGAMTLN